MFMRLLYIINKNLHNSKDFLYHYDLQGSCSWESIKDSFKDSAFINRGNSYNLQALSIVVIHNDTVCTQRRAADSPGNQTQR